MLTVNLDEKKFSHLRTKAEREGRSLDDLVEKAVQEMYGTGADDEPMPHANDPIVLRARELFGKGTDEFNKLIKQMTPDQVLAAMDGIVDLGPDASVDVEGQVRAHFRKKYGDTD